jgi:hypothetical protein
MSTEKKKLLVCFTNQVQTCRFAKDMNAIQKSILIFPIHYHDSKTRALLQGIYRTVCFLGAKKLPFFVQNNP